MIPGFWETIWYYLVILSICRIGHKPNLTMDWTSANGWSAVLRCDRCERTLAMLNARHE